MDTQPILGTWVADVEIAMVKRKKREFRIIVLENRKRNDSTKSQYKSCEE